MDDPVKTTEIRRLLVAYLSKNPKSSARRISKNLRLDKKIVNPVLYANRAQFASEGDSPPLWSTVFLEDKGASPSNDGLEARLSEPPEEVENKSARRKVARGDGTQSPLSPGEIELSRAAYLEGRGLMEDAAAAYASATKKLLNPTPGETTSRDVGAGIDTDDRRRSGLRDRDPSTAFKYPVEEMYDLSEEVESVAKKFPGIFYDEIAALTAYPIDVVRGCSRNVRWLIQDRGSSEEIDREGLKERERELLAAVTTAGTMAFPLSSNDYDDLLRKGFVKGVTSTRLMQIFGTWSHACDLADVEAPRANREHYETRWTDQELVSAVASYLLDYEFRGAMPRYDEWRKQQKNSEDLPSMGTLKLKLGRNWRTIRNRGLDILRQRWLNEAEGDSLDG
jgi:hypothetical protein